jgi:hypothetical protein
MGRSLSGKSPHPSVLASKSPGTGVEVGVGVSVGVDVGMGVKVGVGVFVAPGVLVGDGVEVTAVATAVGVGPGSGSGDIVNHIAIPMRTTPTRNERILDQRGILGITGFPLKLIPPPKTAKSNAIPPNTAITTWTVIVGGTSCNSKRANIFLSFVLMNAI